MPQSKWKVMVVDDDPLNLRMIEATLKKEGYQIFLVKSGSDGLKMAAELKPDIILMDVMMPRMDGFEACAKLKSNPDLQHIPVIFLTSKSDSEGIIKGFNSGAADYVTRPFNHIELLARIKTHLDLHDSHARIVELERKNSILAMVGTTNHEINQPLTVLTGNLYLLKRALNDSPDLKNHLHLIERMEKAVEKIQTILAKFRNAASMRFERYAGNSNIVVFDDEPDKKNDK